MISWPDSQSVWNVVSSSTSSSKLFTCETRETGQEIEEKPDESILGTNYRDVSCGKGKEEGGGRFPAFAHLLSGLPPTWFPCSSLEFQPPHVANRTSTWRYPVVRIKFAIPRRDATFPAVFPPLALVVTRARNSRRRRVSQLDFAGNRVGIIFPYQLGRAITPPRRADGSCYLRNIGT